MSEKYGNNTPPKNIKRVYTINGLPVLDNIILPSNNTINNFKDKAMFCLGKLGLTPFPKIVDQNPYWTEFLKNFIKGNDFSNIDDNLYENLPTKMQLLHDFLKEDESDIFIGNGEERKLRVCFIRRGVIHNQLEFTLTSEELEMILFNKNDPFSELS